MSMLGHGGRNLNPGPRQRPEKFSEQVTVGMTPLMASIIRHLANHDGVTVQAKIRELLNTALGGASHV